MDITLSEEFEEWSRLLQAELGEIIEPIGREEGNYGFALAVPEDAGSACLMYAVGNESRLAGEQPGSQVWLDRRYLPVEWVENWSGVPGSTDALQGIVAEFEARKSAATLSESEIDQAHEQFISDCATACMNAMIRCDRDGMFGKIWYKVLFMSDTDHPVLAEAFGKLNRGRALEEAAPLFDSDSKPIAQLASVDCDQPYSNDELATLAEGELPGRGVYCDDCEIHVPIFASVNDPEKLNGIGFKDTLQKLMKVTGCPKKWAEIWMYHPNGVCNTKRCQACGEFLRTKLAKQCISCGAEWRDN